MNIVFPETVKMKMEKISMQIWKFLNNFQKHKKVIAAKVNTKKKICTKRENL